MMPPFVMRLVVWLLLVLVLPGLSVPAGTLWHVCRCAKVAAPSAPSCCSHHAASANDAPDDERASSCCRHAAPRDRADDRREGDPPTASAACGCIWVALGEDRPDPTPPQTPAPLLLPVAGFEVLLPRPHAAPAAPARAWSSTRIRPPPPDHARNLPLRL
jgi:hypothetical protein